MCRRNRSDVVRSQLMTIMASHPLRRLVSGIVLPPCCEQISVDASIRPLDQALGANWFLENNAQTQKGASSLTTKSKFFCVPF